MAVVYLVNDGGKDYSKLEQYGRVVALSEGRVDFLDIEKIKFMFLEKLIDSTKDDMVALSGREPLPSIAVALMIELHGKANLLIFGARDEDYTLKIFHPNIPGSLSNPQRDTAGAARRRGAPNGMMTYRPIMVDDDER